MENSTKIRPMPIQQETPMGGTAKRDQFEATKKFKEALRIIYNEMPLRTHRGHLYLRKYPDSFSGEEAVDIAVEMLPRVFVRKNCNRETAKNLLEWFLRDGYLVNVRDENNRTSKKFCDDNATFYRFCPERIEEMLNGYSSPNKRPNSLLMRTSSVRDSPATSGNFVQKNRLHSVGDDGDSGGKLHGRLSISCQDISTTEQPPPSPITKSKGSHPTINFSGLIETIGKASASLLSLHRSNSASTAHQKRKASNSTNPKFIADSVLRERASSTADTFDVRPAVPPSRNACTTTKSVFDTGKNVGIRQRQPLLSRNNHRTFDVNQTVYTEADEFKFWRSTLILKFKTLSSYGDVSRLLPSEFSGANVKWNVKRISASTGEVQRIPEQNDELHRDLVASLRRLCQWDNNSPAEISTKNLYELFISIKEYLSKIAPLIPQAHAQSMMAIMDHFAKLRTTGTLDSLQNVPIDKRLHLCIRFCSLTLPPNILRKLQILCKLIRQISSNTKLMQYSCWDSMCSSSNERMPSNNRNSGEPIADRIERNRLRFLRSLCPYLIGRSSISRGFSSSDFSGGSKSLALFKMLVEHKAECLIQIPRWLEEEVQKEIEAFDTTTRQLQQQKSFVTIPTNSYCDRIDKSTYEAQSKSADQHLLALLDQILADENLSADKKIEQLKKFRVSYPSIYLQRFPANCDNDPLRSVKSQGIPQRLATPSSAAEGWKRQLRNRLAL